MANQAKLPDGVTVQTHKRVTMRNVASGPSAADGRGRYIVTEEAIDYVPKDDVDAYVEDARTRWQEVFATNVNAAAPPVYR